VDDNLIVWRETFRVRSQDMDDLWRLRFTALCNFLQESAVAHAQALGMGRDALLTRNLTWVLSRFHVRLGDHPAWGRDLTVETWPSAVLGQFALREFRILDTGGRELGAATSSWMVIDLMTKKPALLPEFIAQLHVKCPGRALADPFDKIPSPEKTATSRLLAVRRSDLDVNRHVNFVKTIEFGLEAVPASIWEKRQVADLEISFRSEIVLGDNIETRAGFLFKEPLRLGHSLVRVSDGLETARLATTWTAGS
jgi:medium-chain acyl-[acyl-carrier-protein] hydrolase